MTNGRNQKVDVHTAHPQNAPLARWWRRLVVFTSGLFIASLAFPLIASISDSESFPLWLGYIDVGLAFALVSVAIFIGTITRNRVDEWAAHLSYRLYRAAANLLIVLLVAFFIFGDRIKWNVLLPGLAWRTWLLWHFLPVGLTAWRANKITEDQDQKGVTPGGRKNE